LGVFFSPEAAFAFAAFDRGVFFFSAGAFFAVF